MTIRIIDPHIHLFDLEKGDYAWLKTANAPFWEDKHKIARNFSDADLSLDGEFVLDAYVHIEAGFNNQSGWEEVEHWQTKAKKTLKCVQVCDLTESPKLFEEKLLKGIQNASFIGVRDIIDERHSIFENENLLHNFKCLQSHKIAFELQLPLENNQICRSLFRLLDKVGEIDIRLNHVGFLPLNDKSSQQNWTRNAKELSNYSISGVKLSGFEMQKRQYDDDDFCRACDFTFNSFEEKTIMLASNFPLVLFSKNYQTFWEFAHKNLQVLGLDANKFMFENANEIYNFGF